MIINIVCGAPHDDFDVVSFQSETMKNIGVDRGTLFLMDQGLPIAHAIGDFDSLTKAEFNELKQKHIPMTVLSSFKDETDTEVAIEIAKSYEPVAIHFYYALGGRIDHSIANMKLLMRLKDEKFQSYIMYGRNVLQILKPGTYEFTHFTHPYVSFFALDETVKNLSLKGFKYELDNYQLHVDDIRCISNETLGHNVCVTFEKGYLLMINSAD